MGLLHGSRCAGAGRAARIEMTRTFQLDRRSSSIVIESTVSRPGGVGIRCRQPRGIRFALVSAGPGR